MKRTSVGSFGYLLLMLFTGVESNFTLVIFRRLACFAPLVP